jgi:hypothetical protein
VVPRLPVTDYLDRLALALERGDRHRALVAQRDVLDRLRVYRRRHRSDRYRFATGSLFDAVMFTNVAAMTPPGVEVLKRYAHSLFIQDTKDVTDEYLPKMRRELEQAGFRLHPEVAE